MKSKTSFFNLTVFKKDITRFFPVWGVYSIILALYYMVEIPYYWAYGSRSLRIINDLQLIMGGVNVLYACLCAMMLFGDLYKSRLCNALHAMPVRREGWFFTHVTAGLLFCIVPNTLLAIGLAPVLENYWYLSFLMLGISVMQYVAFFGMAVFAVMCAGNKVGMGAIYGALHGWPLLLYGIISEYFHPITYGLRADEDLFLKLSPFGHLFEMEYVDIDTYYDIEARSFLKDIVGENILIVAVFAMFGLLLMGAALLLYRRRKLETAGDFIAIRPVAVVFQVLLCMVTALLCKGISEDYVIGFIGIALGFFAGKMLLQKKANVFQKRSFAICGIILVSSVALLLTARWDPLRLTWKVPKAEQVKSVQVWKYSSYGYPIMDAQEQEDIELVLQIHQKLVEERPETYLYNPVIIEYTLQNGSKLKRYYPVMVEDLDQEALQTYFSQWERVFRTDDWEGFCNHITSLQVVGYKYGRDIHMSEAEDLAYGTHPLDAENRTKALELLEVMKRECGKVRPILSPTEYDEDDYTVYISCRQQGKVLSIGIRVSSECTESVAMIEALMEEYDVH